MGWRGPRTLVLHKNSQGFGFTLRHFIVYPPESTLHANLKVRAHGRGVGGDDKSCLLWGFKPAEWCVQVRDKADHAAV